MPSGRKKNWGFDLITKQARLTSLFYFLHRVYLTCCALMTSGNQRGALIDLVNFLHLFITQQTELHRLDVFLHLRNGLEARDGNRQLAAGPDPGEGNLSEGARVAGIG